MWELPEKQILENEFIQLCPLDIDKHLKDLFKAASFENNENQDIFTFMVSFGPFYTIDSMNEYLNEIEKQNNRITWTIFNKVDSIVVGSISLVNINNRHGTLEIGSVWINSKYQGTYTSICSMELIIKYLFEKLKYRRIAWQCDCNNIRSRKFAESIGFKYEGTFRNHYWAKGKNRDTNWLSLIIEEKEIALDLIRRKMEKLTTAST